jgi:hypothetical protein
MKLSKLATIGAAVLLSSSAFASNMGFKLVYPLSAAAGGNTGTNWVSIPYFNSFTTASTVFADIPNCVQVSHYVRASDTYEDYTGGPFDPDFTVAKGEAVLIKVSANSNWTIVGSHDNAFAVPLNAAAGGNTGTNWVSLPYHTNKTNASTLFAEIPNAVQVSHYVKANDTYEDYTGGPFDPDFTLTIGEGILVKVSATSSTWAPAHY